MTHTMKSAAMISLFLMLFFIAFEPFGLDDIPRSESIMLALVYGGINFLIIVIVQAFLLAIFPRFMIEDTWTIGKEVLKYFLLFFCITMALTLINGWYSGVHLRPMNFLVVFMNVLLLASLPVAGAIAYNYNKKLKISLVEAQVLNQQINATNDISSTTLADQLESVTIQSDNQSESFDLLPDDFLYAVSASNYIDVFYLKEGQKSQQTIRSSLKKMEETHGNLKQFSRCHRTYIVNLDKVASFEGNSRGYIITLIDDLGSIPVSRGYIGRIKEIIGQS